jgi:hypothetical protein
MAETTKVVSIHITQLGRQIGFGAVHGHNLTQAATKGTKSTRGTKQKSRVGLFNNTQQYFDPPTSVLLLCFLCLMCLFVARFIFDLFRGEICLTSV